MYHTPSYSILSIKRYFFINLFGLTTVNYWLSAGLVNTETEDNRF